MILWVEIREGRRKVVSGRRVFWVERGYMMVFFCGE